MAIFETSRTTGGTGGARRASVEWRVASAPVPYETALATMEERVAAIRDGTLPELVWLLEHPPLFTAGTSADESEMLNAGGLPVHRTGRGGRYTYHGPGQRVAYVMLDLKRGLSGGPGQGQGQGQGQPGDIRAHVCALEDWMIATLAAFNVKGERRPGRIGIWVDLAAHGGAPGSEAKIGAIGVRVRRWVAYHGLALNVAPDLSNFRRIIPCGIREHGVTSLEALGITASLEEVDMVMRDTFPEIFGRPIAGEAADKT
ncbi:MAG: lipoyl(octanoyl) transferase LipB [Alphaproteobacteria bacterium]